MGTPRSPASTPAWISVNTTRSVLNKLVGSILSSRWTKVVAFVLCLVPFLLLAWPFYKLLTAGYAPELTANPVEYITHDTGTWTIRFLLITLCITPLRKILNQPK